MQGKSKAPPRLVNGVKREVARTPQKAAPDDVAAIRRKRTFRAVGGGRSK